MTQIKSTTTTKTTSAAYSTRVAGVGDLIIDERGTKAGKGELFTKTPYLDIAPTTQELINGQFKYHQDHVVNTSGFLNAGSGGGPWKQNGITGQTISQSPAQLGDALFNDGLGNFVHDITIIAELA